MNTPWVKNLLPLPGGRVNGRLYGWPRRNILWLFMTIEVVFCCASKSHIIFVKSTPKKYFVTGFVDLHNGNSLIFKSGFTNSRRKKVQHINRRYQEQKVQHINTKRAPASFCASDTYSTLISQALVPRFPHYWWYHQALHIFRRRILFPRIHNYL